MRGDGRVDYISSRNEFKDTWDRDSNTLNSMNSLMLTSRNQDR